MAVSVNAITFDTKPLHDNSSSNYVKFIGENPKYSDYLEKQVADFNNDGHDDILSLGGILYPMISVGAPMGNLLNMEVSLYKDGEYVLHDMGINTWSKYINIVDIDKDQDLDIVLVNGKIAINDGAANFSLITFSDDPLGNQDFFSTDIDKDGDVDIVTANSLFINDGSLNFNSLDNPVVDSRDVFIVSDLNNDNIPDILVNNDDFLESWINDGTGQYSLLSSLEIPSDNTFIEAIDVNEDLAQDFILSFITHTSTGNDVEIKLLINDGIGNLSINEFIFPELNDVERVFMEVNKIFIQDADNDGDVDVLISTIHLDYSCSYQRNLLVIYKNTSDGNLEYFKSLQTNGYYYWRLPFSNMKTTPTLIDLDQDNMLDVVMPGEKPVAWLQNGNWKYEFQLSNASTLQYNQYINVFDFDNDGNADILSSAMPESSDMPDENCRHAPESDDFISTKKHTGGRLWLGDGDGGFAPFDTIEQTFVHDTIFSKLLNLDSNDSGKYLIYTLPETNSSPRTTFYQYIEAFNPIGTSTSLITFPQPSISFEIADMTNNGIKDLVMLTDDEVAAIIIYRQSDNSRDLVAFARLDFGYRDGEIKLADMDNDGKIDIIANSKAETNSITIWYNQGSGEFIASESFANDVNAIAISDFNKDGKKDIFSANAAHEMWLNQGDRIFTSVDYDTFFWIDDIKQREQNLVLYPKYKIEVKDINNDGLDDLFMHVNGDIRVYMNNSNNNISFYKNYSSNRGHISKSNVGFADFNNDGLMDFVSGSEDSIKIHTQKHENLYSGIYLDSTHAGHAYSIEEIGRHNLYHSIFFTYDDSGNPEWYSMLTRLEANEERLELNRINASNIISYIYDFPTNSTTVNNSPEHQGWLNFSSDKGSNNPNRFTQADYKINNEMRRWNIDKIIPDTIKPNNDLSGIWWAGVNDASWGVSLSFMQRGEIMDVVAIVYFYDENGNPRWLLGHVDGFELNQDVTIAMNQYIGYGRLQNYVELTRVFAGTITLNLQKASNGLVDAGSMSMDLLYPDDQTNNNWIRNNIPIALITTPRN